MTEANYQQPATTSSSLLTPPHLNNYHQDVQRDVLQTRLDHRLPPPNHQSHNHPLLDCLSQQTGPFIDHSTLSNDHITIAQFDPKSDLSRLNTWYFTPLFKERLRRYALVKDTDDDGDELGQAFSDFIPIPNPTTLRERIAPQPIGRAQGYVTTLYYLFLADIRNAIRKTLADKTGWHTIVYPNTFFCRDGMLCNRGRQPIWTQVKFENRDSISSGPGPGLPHVMFLAAQDTTITEGVNDHEILLGELGPMVQWIRNRLEQEEFAHTAFFPVLVVSFCGLQHGRIIQGCFNHSGVLELKVSKLYSFMMRAEAPFGLFLRFLANEPKMPPEIGLR